MQPSCSLLQPAGAALIVAGASGIDSSARSPSRGVDVEQFLAVLVVERPVFELVLQLLERSCQQRLR